MDGMSWALLLIYFGAWSATPLLFGELTPPWLVVAAAYALGHYYEMTRKGHCALSADASALPLALLAAIVVAVFALESSEQLLALGKGFVIAFGVGHLLAFALVALYSALFERG